MSNDALGLDYLEGRSNEERLAGLLLCLKQLESNPSGGNNPESSTQFFEQILSRVSPLFIARLVCTDQPVARGAGVTFLSLLPDALAPRFREHALLLLHIELKDGSQSTDHQLVFDLVVRSMRTSSSAEVTAFIENADLRTSKLSSPVRLLGLVADLSAMAPSPLVISPLAQTQLRDLAAQCLYSGASPQSLRSSALVAINTLLRSLDAAWTVEPPGDARRPGTLAQLVCSIARGELLLLLELTLPSQGEDKEDSDSAETLVACAGILHSVMVLLVGGDVDQAGVWEELPCESLLSIRKVIAESGILSEGCNHSAECPRHIQLFLHICR